MSKARYDLTVEGNTAMEVISDLADLAAEVAAVQRERAGKKLDLQTQRMIRDLCLQVAFHAADHYVDRLWHHPMLQQPIKEEFERLNHTLRLRKGQPYTTYAKTFSSAKNYHPDRQIGFGYNFAGRIEKKLRGV